MTKQTKVEEIISELNYALALPFITIEQKSIVRDEINRIHKKALASLAPTTQEPSKLKGSKYLGLIDLESKFPLADWERKKIIEYSMECLLEEGELGKLGKLLHRFEDTVRYFENKNPVKEFLNNKSRYTKPTPPCQECENLKHDLEGYMEANKALVNREWVGLSDEEIESVWIKVIKYGISSVDFTTRYARAIEQALKEKNNGI